MFGYKIIYKSNRAAIANYTFKDKFLPRHGRPGEWLPKRKGIGVCFCGWHFCKNKRLIKAYAREYDMYSDKYNLYLVEVKGEIIHDEEKSVSEEMRILKKIDFWFDGVSL